MEYQSSNNDNSNSASTASNGPIQSFTATYSPEDNKLRLYSSSRLDADLYARVKAAGFSYAPKQGLFVAPMWTPQREGLLLELCGEIDDEDKSLVERAEERSERFTDYSESRTEDAERAQKTVAAIADGIPFGQPILIGHHSERHHRKAIEQIDNGMRRAVKMWDTARYWTDRADAALRHAKYKEQPDVRARRIKGLEADIRRYQAAFTPDPKTKPQMWNGEEHVWCTNGTRGGYWQKSNALPKIKEHYTRWINHTQNRLAYERAMLDAAGGTVADRNRPERGGACRSWVRGGRWIEILKVNKISVTVADNWGNGGPDFTRTIPLHELKAVLSQAEFAAMKAAEESPSEQ